MYLAEILDHGINTIKLANRTSELCMNLYPVYNEIETLDEIFISPVLLLK